MEIRIGTKNYECEQFGIMNLADTLDWMQGRHEQKIIAKAHLVYGDDLPDRVYDDLKKEVSIDAIKTDIRAMVYLIWLAVKNKTPGVSFEQIQADIGGVTETTSIFDSLSPDDTEPKKKVTPTKPKRKKRPSKKS